MTAKGLIFLYFIKNNHKKTLIYASINKKTGAQIFETSVLYSDSSIVP